MRVIRLLPRAHGPSQDREGLLVALGGLDEDKHHEKSNGVRRTTM